MGARAALKVLFELLEEYAPMWYTEEHNRLAVVALATSHKCRSGLPILGCDEGAGK